MIATTAGLRTEEVSRQLLELATRVSLATLPGRRRTGELKELEYLALTVLSERGPMIVGDIQRRLGVLPAQMSRIIRSLENRERPLITCGINPRDKRKIDVCITTAGHKALADFQAGRANSLAGRLRNLQEEDREDVVRSLERITGLLERPNGQ